MIYYQKADKRTPVSPDMVVNFIKTHKVVRYILYAGGAVIGVWLIGKSAKLLADATINIKAFRNAIQNNV